MDCFIKKVFLGKVDRQVHSQFVRFGRGVYEGRAVISLHKTKKIKLRGSFEFANDFVDLVAGLGNFKFSGIIMSREKLDFGGEKKKSGIYIYEVKDLDSEQIKEIKDKIYFMLLDSDNEDLKLKIKKNLPKPGKSGEAKINDKFCQLDADLKYYEKIKDAFFWDVGDCKKVKAEHVVEISEIILPIGEKDFEKLRLLAKKKGRIIRKLIIDKKEKKVEKEFEA